jgi:hypothetical protein
MSVELPVAHAYDGGSIRYMDVYGIAARSEWGQALANQSRWGKFKPPRFSLRKWQNILGHDVNNRDHLKLTYGIDRRFVYYCQNPPPVWRGPVPDDANFPPREQSLLLLTSPVHDLAEAITGDKPGPDKVALDSELEWKYLHTITKSITKGMPALQNDIDYVIDHILKDTDSKLGRAFATIERVGYLLTALRAWRQSTNPDITIVYQFDDLTKRLRALTFGVHTHNMGKILDMAEVYPPVVVLLEANRNTISEVYRVKPMDAARTLQAIENHRTLKELSGKFTVNRDRWYHFLYSRHTRS